MQSSDNYENVLKEMCWNYAYLIVGLEDQYVVNFNNSSTHISSVEIPVGMVGMHKLLPCPC